VNRIHIRCKSLKKRRITALANMRTLLFIAYYLPPMGSSGVQRPLNLLRHLPEYGWNPVVLAPETGYYHTMDFSLEQELNQLDVPIYRVPSKTPFHRVGGAAKQAPRVPEALSKVLRWISALRYIPDNKIGWVEPAFEVAKHIVDKHKPALLFSTSPPPSNLMLAAKIRHWSGIPTVFDMRDDWVGNHQQIYPTPWHRTKMVQLEEKTMLQSDGIVTVNTVIRDALAARHNDYHKPIVSVPSGYDSRHFDRPVKPSLLRDTAKITLLYSGRFYGENQPDVFLQAVANILRKQPHIASRLRLAFQGGLEHRHLKLIHSLGLSERSIDLGYVDHATSVANLMQTDLLWLVAAHRNRGEQVSTGKIYEYMASERPILALAPLNGALHNTIHGYGPFEIADPFSHEAVEYALEKLIIGYAETTLPKVNTDYVTQFSFERMASKMADFFNNVTLARR
jgi:glycosyltransferase involved in cell wall biosynthesis